MTDESEPSDLSRIKTVLDAVRTAWALQLLVWAIRIAPHDVLAVGMAAVVAALKAKSEELDLKPVPSNPPPPDDVRPQYFGGGDVQDGGTWS